MSAKSDLAQAIGYTHEHHAEMKRDLPEDIVVEGHEIPRSMLASRTLWVGGALSAGLWALLFFLVR